MESLSSILSLRIHGATVILITLFSIFTLWSIPRRYVKYWTIAWGCLLLACYALMTAFSTPSLRGVLHPLYFFCEYAFGFMLVAGCRHYASGAAISLRRLGWLVPLVVAAICLPSFADNFDTVLRLHILIKAGFFGTALYWILRANRRGPFSPGWIIICVALVLLPLDLFRYHPLLTRVLLREMPVPLTPLSTQALYNLTLEVVLALGMLMLAMEGMRRQVEEAHSQLLAAHNKLTELARVDPLTEVLNRHAFYALLQAGPQTQPERFIGCAVVIDIDNLKPINDSFGHPTGDAAIRAVARTIRSVIRADDLLFRWGGDEFLILLFNITEAETRRRLDDINHALARIALPGSSLPLAIRVSYGLAPFSSLNQVEPAIQTADQAMYNCKQAQKTQPTFAHPEISRLSRPDARR